jgi:hypothetical protein
MATARAKARERRKGKWVMGCDLAADDSDYSAMVMGWLGNDGVLRITNSISTKGSSFGELCKKIRSQYSPSK